MKMLSHLTRALRPTGMTVLLLAVPHTVEAQTTRTFTACYVPEVGAVYMISEPGLPSSCLSEAHEQFSWTEGENGGVELADLSVTSAKLADGAVLTDKLGNAAVTGPKLANDAVAGVHIDDGAVTSAHIADNSILTTDIGTNTIMGSDIAANAVIAFHIASDAVGAPEIAMDAVTSSEIATNAVGSSEIASNAVGTSEIAPDAVGAAHIAPDAVGPSQLNVNYQRIVSPVTVPAQSSQTFTVGCATSEVFSAGFDPQIRGALEILYSYPASNNSWEIRFRNSSPGDVDVDVWRICMNVN